MLFLCLSFFLWLSWKAVIFMKGCDFSSIYVLKLSCCGTSRLACVLSISSVSGPSWVGGPPGWLRGAEGCRGRSSLANIPAAVSTPLRCLCQPCGPPNHLGSRDWAWRSRSEYILLRGPHLSHSRRCSITINNICTAVVWVSLEKCW